MASSVAWKIMILKVKKLHKDAKLPTHGHPGDAGMDFYAMENVVFPPGKQMHVRTGVAIEIPEGYVGLVWDKSSIAFNLGLKIMGGVIDAGYRGELIMNLLNISDKEVIIEKGHKVAQMIIQKFEHCEILETDKISETVRDIGREGSTGHK
ncbi:TPA: dUTP diphosphatase [Candidatus Nomurabacteria bacterium]|uniref:dUTP diphosphatase n=2 Tax=Candidatus Nomuraibacteriota TaxID=1752729 RepID=A0A0G1EN47_9BACT|nr:MAG: Deoxyuridine 5'-triphosphate nucleotidohydrolase [Parcubacteria group bacterium GW2011_GWC1_42_21]KKS58151.1 MAG: Deoxyuridine 5'-triphosphate nucleotidohydrolase [Candidatus Nomurabacteria bacterium GW2011_GWF1_42_40]KKT00492.1 MAG: Deoxyuridine 5'-triphosphate nucleotidohydrolase [Candidatus Nomurabacteria bacterium GW2011_GWA1_43_17]KKT07836.1 MAG: Deoxyuridine 5'-triphosphate nucleotidohydrolase [Candidatus Nomurabacteria bacterium GW2011_GWB1_43_19]KKT11405.1 MAG: Deoxyuridine 5'-t